jgi:glycosyltransferase involved in cell wall biosynthesis
MKICFIGKYPPIQGGVSMHSYWTAYGLAERGHEVYVVTNAAEVEEIYRINLGDDDGEMLQPVFTASGGLVKVFHPERFSPARMRHIPVSNPFVSKLASLATQTIRQYGCDLIFAYYYEPYAVAGYLASSWTGLPLILKHAGSDLERLMQIPDLATTYKEILKAAAGVITSGRQLVDRFIGMGVKPERIYPAARFAVPTIVFNPQAPPFDGQAISARGGSQLAVAGNGQRRGPDLAKPTIGIYGKVGRVKGSFDLVGALAILKREGLDFNFLAITDGSEFDQFKAALEENDLADRTWLLPFQPHWQVPRFIRTCTAVCFLERDFPIALHGPTVQREILACGTCLILSQEIADKQHNQAELVDQENVLIVSDPKDHQELAGKLRFVIQNPQQARQIGAKGHRISEQMEDFSEYAQQMEALFRRITGQDSTYKSFAELDEAEFKARHNGRSAADQPPAAARAIDQVMPWLRLLIPGQFDDVLTRFGAQQIGSGPHEFKLAYDFCRFLESRLKDHKLQSDYPAFESILRHQQAWLNASFDDEGESGRPFAGVNRLNQRQISWEAVGHLKPVKSQAVHLEILDYDVTPFFTQILQDEDEEISQRSVEKLASTLEKRTTYVYFHKAPNLVSREMKINKSTKKLLELCDGSGTTSAISDRLAQAYGLKNGREAELQTSLLSVLQQLYDAGMIVFC